MCSSDLVLVEVSDAGPGIPEDFRPHIFDRFAQADASDTRSNSGSGLGLAIARGLVERMGGEIGYRSGDDNGSVFWFRLPLADGPQPPDSSPLSSSQPPNESHA